MEGAKPNGCDPMLTYKGILSTIYSMCALGSQMPNVIPINIAQINKTKGASKQKRPAIYILQSHTPDTLCVQCVKYNHLCCSCI